VIDSYIIDTSENTINKKHNMT